MRLLAIETSCDETAAAVVRRDDGQDFAVVETNIVASQADLHSKYGGVYPEVASREHVKQILPVIAESLGLELRQKHRLPDFELRARFVAQAGKKGGDFGARHSISRGGIANATLTSESWAVAQKIHQIASRSYEFSSDIDAIAVTHGPGLIGSLLVGTQTAATLAMVTGKPLLPVNHLAGHIYASWIAPHPNPLLKEEREIKNLLASHTRRGKSEGGEPPKFPLLAMIVSGGHTMLLRMTGHHEYELLGQTRDDAAGEAFDKVAKLLGLGYPGGPLISKLATKGDRHAYNFPIGLEHEKTLDFSFSGLKTAVLREVQKIDKLDQPVKANIAASFERAAVEALLHRITQALNDQPVYDFILGGGVAANSYLRERLAALLAHRDVPVNLHVPPINLCTDNAAVIGAAAVFGNIQPVDPTKLETFSRLPLV